MDFKKASEILNRYRWEGVRYNYVSESGEGERDIAGVEVRILLPFPSNERIGRIMAERIARYHGIIFGEYDANLGREEGPCYKPAFCVFCRSEDEIEPGIERMKLARNELDDNFEKLAEIPFYPSADNYLHD